MSALAPALLDSLSRLLPAPASTGRNAPSTAHSPATLRQVISALAAALERGDLALDLEGPPPPELSPELSGEMSAELAISAAPSSDLSAAPGSGRSGAPGVHASANPQGPGWPQAHLAALEACGWLVDAADLEQRPEAPVVRDGRWLRWRRWHQQLENCRSALLARGQTAQQPALQPLSAAQRRDARRRATAAGLDPQQSRAVEALLEHRLVLLSGGPGTGKTSTVVQMLAAALRLEPGLRLQLAAPTGKAAARLGAAVAQGAAGLEPELAAQLQALPCGTLHRLLEARADGESFRRSRSLPLELDLLVVDEVSMVDLPLMQALLEALPERARLLLVGDPAQLPPVGPGAVLLELCRPESLAALGSAAVELRTTYRNDGAIAELAAELRHQPARGPALLTALRPRLRQLPADANVIALEAAAGQPPADALARLRRHQQRLAERAAAGDEPALLAELERLILLSPVQRGAWGVQGIQRALLGEALRGPLQGWPTGTPVLNRRNLPEQGLANGDIGVLIRSGPGGEALVLFPGGRRLHPARLGAAEPALALTVHKAQGSQYGEVLLLLPPGRGLDARLLYTGLTRARHKARLYIVGSAQSP